MQDALDEAVNLMRALGSGPRLRIMCSLLDGPRNVSEICMRLGMAQSGVSQHLARLRTQRLVVASRRGQFVHYALPETVTRDVIAFIDARFGAGLEADDRAMKARAKSGGIVRRHPRHPLPLVA